MIEEEENIITILTDSLAMTKIDKLVKLANEYRTIQLKKVEETTQIETKIILNEEEIILDEVCEEYISAYKLLWRVYYPDNYTIDEIDESIRYALNIIDLIELLFM